LKFIFAEVLGAVVELPLSPEKPTKKPDLNVPVACEDAANLVLPAPTRSSSHAPTNAPVVKRQKPLNRLLLTQTVSLGDDNALDDPGPTAREMRRTLQLLRTKMQTVIKTPADADVANERQKMELKGMLTKSKNVVLGPNARSPKKLLSITLTATSTCATWLGKSLGTISRNFSLNAEPLQMHL